MDLDAFVKVFPTASVPHTLMALAPNNARVTLEKKPYESRKTQRS
jgi:hypothetical protein